VAAGERLIVALERLTVAAAASAGEIVSRPIEDELRRARDLGELAFAALFGTKSEGPTGEHSEEAPEATLPIADYDTLSATEIIPLLATLTAHEREEIAAYEAAHRRRPRVLAALAHDH
jgi:hypothetical protein